MRPRSHVNRRVCCHPAFPSEIIDWDVCNNARTPRGTERTGACEDAGSEQIEARLVELDGTPRLLYAAMANSIHGDRLTEAEKKKVARSMTEAGIGQQDISDAIHVSIGKVNGWVKDIVTARRRERDAKAWWLGVAGWAQDEIIGEIGDSRQSVLAVLPEFSNLKKWQSPSTPEAGRSPRFWSTVDFFNSENFDRARWTVVSVSLR